MAIIKAKGTIKGIIGVSWLILKRGKRKRTS